MIICDSYEHSISTLIHLEQEKLYSFGRFCIDYKVDNFPAYYYNHDINTKLDRILCFRFPITCECFTDHINCTTITSGFRFTLIKHSDITGNFVVSGINITRIQIYTNNNKICILYDKVYDKESNVNLHFPLINIACCRTDVIINVEAESLSSFKTLNYVLSNCQRKFLASNIIQNEILTYQNGFVKTNAKNKCNIL